MSSQAGSEIAQVSEQKSAAEAPASVPDTPPTPAKRKIAKCAFSCGSAVVKTIGTCRYCSLNFCAKHRLPETHACANLQSCQSAAKDNLAKRLLDEKTVGAKIATA